jgi:hypothetical protein
VIVVDVVGSTAAGSGVQFASDRLRDLWQNSTAIRVLEERGRLSIREQGDGAVLALRDEPHAVVEIVQMLLRDPDLAKYYRIGISTGQMAETSATFSGPALREAMALAHLASPGSATLADATASLLSNSDKHLLTKLPSSEVRGFPSQVYSLSVVPPLKLPSGQFDGTAMEEAEAWISMTSYLSRFAKNLLQLPEPELEAATAYVLMEYIRLAGSTDNAEHERAMRLAIDPKAKKGWVRWRFLDYLRKRNIEAKAELTEDVGSPQSEIESVLTQTTLDSFRGELASKKGEHYSEVFEIIVDAAYRGVSSWSLAEERGMDKWTFYSMRREIKALLSKYQDLF